LSLRRPLRVRRGSQGLRNQNRPLSHHTSAAIGVKILAPDLRDSVLAAPKALTVCSAPTSDRRGGLGGGYVHNEQRSLEPPNNCVTPQGGTGIDGGPFTASAEKDMGRGVVRSSAWSRSVRFSFWVATASGRCRVASDSVVASLLSMTSLVTPPRLRTGCARSRLKRAMALEVRLAETPPRLPRMW
jgi:hypothetical protein